MSARTPEDRHVLANNDSAAPPQNGIIYYEALKRIGVPAEMRVFPESDHGFGSRDTRLLPVSVWPNLAAE